MSTYQQVYNETTNSFDVIDAQTFLNEAIQALIDAGIALNIARCQFDSLTLSGDDHDDDTLDLCANDMANKSKAFSETKERVERAVKRLIHESVTAVLNNDNVSLVSSETTEN